MNVDRCFMTSVYVQSDVAPSVRRVALAECVGEALSRMPYNASEAHLTIDQTLFAVESKIQISVWLEWKIPPLELVQ